ncbi:ubiquitin carboxyl-terminal hydrolase 43a [Pygocentrus nattereri]|uniref:ubiquitinyl hydrolase 1 n=1 Tax=Pygocentrus nattereri TaxID=42514 RepID=A0A3B4CBE5_PYGNA|nr:ubiquitin carboxyl-terminal hydrolase 43a [Pygocentrus nattereri]
MVNMEANESPGTGKSSKRAKRKTKRSKENKRRARRLFGGKSFKSVSRFMSRVFRSLGGFGTQFGDGQKKQEDGGEEEEEGGEEEEEEDDGGFGESARRALGRASDNALKRSSTRSCPPVLSWGGGEKPPGVQGLRNHGNTCFMNAVVQCLSNTDLLAEHLGLGQYKSELREGPGSGVAWRDAGQRGPRGQGEVTEQLALLVRALWTHQYTPQLSVDFKSIVSKHSSQFRGNSQHDALEFLLWLLDRVHEDTNPDTSNTSNNTNNINNTNNSITNGSSNSSKAKPTSKVPVESTSGPDLQQARTRHSFVQEHFQAQYRSSLTCPHCLKQSNTFDPFLCISLPIPLRQTRAVNVTLVFNSKSQRFVRVGLAIPLLGSVHALRALLAQEGNISTEQVILVELYSDGFQRSFSDEDDLTSISESDVIYAFQATPPFSKGSSSRYSGFHHSLPSSPYITGREGQRSLASCTSSAEFLNQSGSSKIILLICNTAGSGQQAARFGPPFLVVEERGVSWAELQQTILTKLYNLMLNSTQAQNAGVLFRIRVVGGSTSCSYLSPQDRRPLLHPAIDRVLKLCGPGGPPHVKLVIEWETKVKECLFGSIQEECVKDAESVREQQQNHLQQHSCTLDDCFQLYTKEEQLAPDDAWKCPHCKQLQQGMLKLSLWTLPDILILHLKRFRQVADRRNKLSTLVRFPMSGLDMAPHVAKRSHSVRNLASWPPTWTHGDLDFLYDLYAVCNHHGGMHGGHYTAYCRNSVDGQWYSYDDSSVDLVPEEELCTKGAYVLFYQRRNAIPPWSANSSVRGSTSSSVSDHWLIRLNGDSKRGSMVSRTSTTLPSIPDPPDSPVFQDEAQKDDQVSLGGFETRPFIRGLQGRSVSMRSPAKPKENTSKLFPLRWSFGSKDKRKPAPAPTAPNASAAPNAPSGPDTPAAPTASTAPTASVATASSNAPAQLVEYLESGRRPRITNDPIAALVKSSSKKEPLRYQKAPEGQKVPEGQKNPDRPNDSPRLAEGQHRPESETVTGQRTRQKEDGALSRRSTRRPKDQAKSQNPQNNRSSSMGIPGAGGSLLRKSRTATGDTLLYEMEGRRDDAMPQDGIMAFLKGGFLKRDPRQGSGQDELVEDGVPGERSISRLSLPSRSYGTASSGMTNGLRTLLGDQLVNGRAIDIKRSQSSSSIPRRTGENLQRAVSLQRNGMPGLPRNSTGEKNPHGTLQRTQNRYSSSSTLGRRRAVPESSF